MNDRDKIQPVKMTDLEKMGEILFRLRDYTPIPILIVGFLFAQPTLTALFCGFFIAACGEFIRAYGVAFIGTISRTRSYSNGELVKTGPFSLLRNPLYFGNLILSLGLGTMSGLWWLPLIIVLVFYIQYIPIVAWEEMKLRSIFGEKYTLYCQEVPSRWFPSVGRLFHGEWCAAPVRWGPAWKSEKRTLTSFFAYVILMGLLFGWNQVQGGTFLPLVEKIRIGG